MTFPGLVYVLCFVTCVACVVLLTRAWLRTRTRLLLWTAISFVFLALNNLLVVVDLLVFADADLTTARYLAALIAGAVLIFAFVWEAD